MNADNSRMPLLWAYMALAGYPFLGSIFGLVFGPYSWMRKIGLAVGLLALCVSVTFVAVSVIRRPIPADQFRLNVIPLFFAVLSLIQAGGGGLALYSLLTALPLKVESVWHFYLNVGPTLMLPFGILACLFAMWQLILNRKSKRLQS